MKRIALAIALSLLGSVFVMEANAARVCKSSNSTKGSDSIKSVAKTEGKVRWSAKVAAKYAPKYANWSNAKSKKITCKKKTTLTGINLYTCKIRAKPCYYK